MLNSATGQLTLDTGTLGFSDIQDHDTATSVSGQVGIGLGLQPNGTGQPGQPSGTVSGSYASHTIEQATRATIGAGTIVIRNEDKQKQDVADINRDIDQAQVITKNEREAVQVYASSEAIKEIGSGFEGIQYNFQKSASTLGHLDQLAAEAFGTGKSIAQVLGLMLSRSEGPALAKALSDNDLSPTEALKQLRSGCGPGRQGFNLHDLIFTPAYADSCTLTTISGKQIQISDVKNCTDVLVSALMGQALAVSWNSAEFAGGIKDGAIKQGQEFVELVADPVGLAQSLSGLVLDLLSDPKETALKLGVATVEGMQEKAYKYL